MSLAYAVFGAFCAGRLNSSSIGRAMALLRNKTAKHSIKQVDRLLGNKKFSFKKYITHLVLWLLGRKEISSNHRLDGVLFDGTLSSFH